MSSPETRTGWPGEGSLLLPSLVMASELQARSKFRDPPFAHSGSFSRSIFSPSRLTEYWIRRVSAVRSYWTSSSAKPSPPR